MLTLPVLPACVLYLACRYCAADNRPKGLTTLADEVQALAAAVAARSAQQQQPQLNSRSSSLSSSYRAPAAAAPAKPSGLQAWGVLSAVAAAAQSAAAEGRDTGEGKPWEAAGRSPRQVSKAAAVEAVATVAAGVGDAGTEGDMQTGPVPSESMGGTAAPTSVAALSAAAPSKETPAQIPPLTLALALAAAAAVSAPLTARDSARSAGTEAAVLLGSASSGRDLSRASSFSSSSSKSGIPHSGHMPAGGAAEPSMYFEARSNAGSDAGSGSGSGNISQRPSATGFAGESDGGAVSCVSGEGEEEYAPSEWSQSEKAGRRSGPGAKGHTMRDSLRSFFKGLGKKGAR